MGSPRLSVLALESPPRTSSGSRILHPSGWRVYLSNDWRIFRVVAFNFPGVVLQLVTQPALGVGDESVDLVAPVIK